MASSNSVPGNAHCLGSSACARADSCCPAHVACRLVLGQLTCCCQRYLTLKRGSSAPIHSTGQCVDCFGTTSCHHTSWPSLKLTFSRLAASTWSYTSTVLMVCPCASTFCTAVSTIPCKRSCHSVTACSRSQSGHQTSWPSLKAPLSYMAASTWLYTSTVLVVLTCSSTLCNPIKMPEKATKTQHQRSCLPPSRHAQRKSDTW